MDKNTTIDREAVSKTKGFRLQKIRLIELVLAEIEKCDKVFVYGAIELLGDINLNKTNSGTSETYLEENKNYKEESTFTINSPEVLNTLVIFLDLWVNKWKFDNNIRFGFYSTNKIGKENKTSFINEKNLNLPKESVLQLLANKTDLNAGTLSLFVAVLTNEFESQYKKSNPQRIELVKKLNNNQWKEFINLINWRFGEEDEKALKIKVIEDIKKSKYYFSEHEGKEQQIFSELMEIIEERQFCNNITERFIFHSDVELIFIKAQINIFSGRMEDPVWKQWETLEPTETRNIKEKIKAVCDKYSEKKIGLKSIIAARGHNDKKEYEKDRSFLSLRYRVYEIAMKKIISLNINGHYSDVQVDSFFIDIFSYTVIEINKLKGNYKYNICSDDIIEGILHELFDSCFLSLDK